MKDQDEIILNDVSKRFGSKAALNKVSLRVKKGAVYGLIGPNGAGKSTLIRILATLALPDEGTVSISGLDVAADVKEVRKKIGVTFQDTLVSSLGTAWDHFFLAGKMYGMSNSAIRARAEFLLKEFQLMRASHDSVSTYSGGMRRKLDIALSLLHKPEILILDEPTTGLDPESRNALWHIISSISEK